MLQLVAISCTLISSLQFKSTANLWKYSIWRPSEATHHDKCLLKRKGLSWPKQSLPYEILYVILTHEAFMLESLLSVINLPIRHTHTWQPAAPAGVQTAVSVFDFVMMMDRSLDKNTSSNCPHLSLNQISLHFIQYPFITMEICHLTHQVFYCAAHFIQLI